MNPEQIKLFGKENKPITTEDILEKKEEERIANLCTKCKEHEKTGSYIDAVRNLCDGCGEKHFQGKYLEFNIPNGFRDDGDEYVFYSSTTGIERVKKDRVLAVLCKDRIQTCDEFGCFEHCYGITEEFAEQLIKDLKLEEEKENDITTYDSEGEIEETYSNWINKAIIPDENAKKIAEKKKSLSEKKADMMKDINEIKELENEQITKE